MRKLIVFLLAVMLSGCAGSPIRINTMTAEELKTQETHNICAAYKFARKTEIRNELQRRRQLFDESEKKYFASVTTKGTKAERERLLSNRLKALRNEPPKSDEWDLIHAKQIKIGMTQCSLLASWGQPDRINSSASRYGSSNQWIYNVGFRFIRASYVYVSGGKVSAWQK